MYATTALMSDTWDLAGARQQGRFMRFHVGILSVMALPFIAITAIYVTGSLTPGILTATVGATATGLGLKAALAKLLRRHKLALEAAFQLGVESHRQHMK